MSSCCCKSEYPNDPRKCISLGKAVTSCSLQFFQKMKMNCRHEFEKHAECIDKSSSTFMFAPCRNTQGVYDKCMLDKLNIERPPFGYFCEAKVLDSKRPKPKEEIQIFDDASPSLPDDFPREQSKYSGRYLFR